MTAFHGFDTRYFDLGDARIHARIGGRGPLLMLLHGYPQTHMIWAAVARQLVDRFTLVVPDLRGYGRSTGPAPDAAHLHYSKRAMAADMFGLADALGHSQFFVAGHDRGARVAYRMALDQPSRITRLAVLDIVPTYEMWSRMNHAGALRSYHWSFLAQPAPMPEHLIGADPGFYLLHLLKRWAGNFDAIPAESLADYQRAFAQPDTITATCADYRAGASVDVEHDRVDLEAGRRIDCPTHVIWGRQYLSSQSPLATWQRWCRQEPGETAIDCGHFIAEEQPVLCAQALAGFFGA